MREKVEVNHRPQALAHSEGSALAVVASGLCSPSQAFVWPMFKSLPGQLGATAERTQALITAYVWEGLWWMQRFPAQPSALQGFARVLHVDHRAPHYSPPIRNTHTISSAVSEFESFQITLHVTLGKSHNSSQPVRQIMIHQVKPL